jgi:MscS family membrane protein
LPAKPAEVIESISFSKILWTVVFLIFGYLFTRMLVKVMSLIAEKSPRARITIKSLIPVVRIIIWVILISAIIKGIFNPPIETIITVGASIGIALGLAAQDLLKNVFGGLALLFDRPFQVGDKIEAGDHYGEVIEIGLRTTRMVTGDDSVVILPNAELINVSVLNSNYGKIYCQVTADIFLPINIDVEKVRKIAEEAARVSRYVYLQMPVVALFKNEINEQRSYLKMELKAYVMDIRYELKFKSDMTEIVIRELLKAGIISKDDLF